MFYFRQGQLSSTSQTSHPTNIVDNFENSRQTLPTGTTTVPNNGATDLPATSTHPSSRFPLTSPSTARTASTTVSVLAFRRHDSSGTDGVFTYTSTSNTSEDWKPSSDTDDYYYSDTDETKTDDKQTGLLTNSSETAEAAGGRGMEKADDEGSLTGKLFTTDDAVLNLTTREDIDGSSVSPINSNSLVAKHAQSQTSLSTVSTSTSTVSPLSTAWLLAELPPDSDTNNDVHSSDEYMTAHRGSHAMLSPSATLPVRIGSHWRLVQRQSRPNRRRTEYRQILASPFVAGGGAMTERERKRALLHAYLLSGIAAKDLSHRRAMSAAVFYRSTLAKPPPTQYDMGEPPRQTSDLEQTASNSPTSRTTSDYANVTSGWMESLDNSSSTWNISTSLDFSVDSWTTSENNGTTGNITSDNELVSAAGAQLHRMSSGRAAHTAVVIPIIVGFLESLIKKQFSWLDLALAVCGTVALVLGLINLVVFVMHLWRSKHGKLSFHADRQQLANGPSSSSSPSSMSASRSSSDSTPPPPPPPPPLPLAGFGGLSRSSREVSRDVLADDETLRIRPLTFKRPLTDWGFTSSHGTVTDAAVVTGPSGAVTVKSTGSDASSGIESNGGRSDGGSTRKAPENMAASGSVITNYAYCGNGGLNKGIIIDVDEYRDRTCTSPSDFVFSKNYGQY